MSTNLKYALVTGASRGIGKAIAINLAETLGYNIIVNYNSNKEAALSVKQEIESKGYRADILKFDVGDAQATASALAAWQSNHEDVSIEIIVNNAGITKDGLFLWMNQEDWNSVINTSLNAFFNVTQPLLKSMLTKRYGRIINIVSLAGLKGNAGQVNYSAAKSGVIGATKALAQEVAKRQITVNAVAPGFIDTDMTASFDTSEYKNLIPANRFGKVNEVADLVSFLASKKASYITGEVININGGLYS